MIEAYELELGLAPAMKEGPLDWAAKLNKPTLMAVSNERILRAYARKTSACIALCWGKKNAYLGITVFFQHICRHFVGSLETVLTITPL